jgi:hypothetical protein
MDALSAWLQGIGLERYAPVFVPRDSHTAALTDDALMR